MAVLWLISRYTLRAWMNFFQALGPELILFEQDQPHSSITSLIDWLTEGLLNSIPVVSRMMQSGHLCTVSISHKISFHEISQSLEGARLSVKMFVLLWNLTGTLAAVLPMCQSNSRTMVQFWLLISWLRDFARAYNKTSLPILKRGPASTKRYGNGVCYQGSQHG